jgi:outer membrane lipoprotein-sorting protein
MFESFLSIGFGGSGRDLQSVWKVSYQDAEKLDGIDVVKLELKPKQARVQQEVERVVIWIDPERDISVKQAFYSSSGDVRTLTYSKIKYNGNIPSSVFSIRTDAKTQILHK